MVFIHGGAFFTGSSYEFSPYLLMNKDIILVTIQYRLGILGFLSTEDDILPGNMGLKDQQLALKWVKENIHCFGGDPNLVTIFGESSGGASVHLQMFSPGSRGLFQRVIIQSGTAMAPFAYKNNHIPYAKAAGDHVNCSLERGAQKYLECMQDADLNELILYATRAM
ncbi:Bile salt-activated lipase, partial [Armadillidium nasatum]